MYNLADYVLWPDKANYERFVEICDDIIEHRTVEEYHAFIIAELNKKPSRDARVKLIKFNPDDLRRWADNNGREVDAEARTEFAIVLAKRKRAGRYYG